MTVIDEKDLKGLSLRAYVIKIAFHPINQGAYLFQYLVF